MLRHAQRMLASFADARRELDGLRSGDLAPLRIAAFPTACAGLVPKATALWRHRFPALPFELTECDCDEAVELARHGKADAALAYDYAAHPIDLKRLAVQALPDDPLLLALPASHPLAAAPVVEIRALRAQPWVSGTSFACAESLRAICGVAGFTPVVALESSRYPTILGLVAAGHGAALVPASASANPPPGVAVRPLRPAPPARRTWVVTPAEPTEPVAHLIDCLLATSTSTAGRA